MGGGGGRDYGLPIINKLEKVAEKAFDKAEPAKRNVFISFDHRDAQQVNLLRGQAKNENNDLEFNDYSLKEPFNSERAEYIKAGIREKIRQSSVTVIFVSECTHESDWVNWEARESKRLGKGIICVYQGDKPPSRLPDFVRDLGVKTIQWKHKTLSDEIEEAARSR
jgi:hypothetical protein